MRNIPQRVTKKDCKMILKKWVNIAQWIIVHNWISYHLNAIFVIKHFVKIIEDKKIIIVRVEKVMMLMIIMLFYAPFVRLH